MVSARAGICSHMFASIAISSAIMPTNRNLPMKPKSRLVVVATTTKRDFGFMGKFLFVGMIALLIAMLANMWLQIPALALTISTLVIVVFSLFLLYDLRDRKSVV